MTYQVAYANNQADFDAATKFAQEHGKDEFQVTAIHELYLLNSFEIKKSLHLADELDTFNRAKFERAFTDMLCSPAGKAAISSLEDAWAPTVRSAKAMSKFSEETV